MFGPDPVGDVQTTAVGESQIAANLARADASTAAGKLSDARRENPDAFKTRLASDLDPDVPLSEQILPGGKGESIIPKSFRAEEAFGAESFFKGGANAFTDFIGAGVFFPEAAEAKAVMGELAARIQITQRAEVFRPNVQIQNLLKIYAEEPQQLFRGDELGRQNLTTTLNALKRSLKRAQIKLDSDVPKTRTITGKLEDAIFGFADTIADLEGALASIQRTEGDAPIVSKRKAAALAAGPADTTGGSAAELTVGQTITLPNGDVIKRTN